ncbi:MAG: HAMP domain-containing histidine kinase [Sphingobacteriaceae bacterium]|nr:MAG: HAMP domain-containing histidine kinase [Sphingobacteriaceae bacterium]
MLKRINTQINRLSSLVSDLLEAGQIGEQQQLLRREEYFFNEMVEDIVAEIQRTTFTHQIIIEKNPQVSFLGDRERTSQVLSNLLSNAIKYSSGQDKVIVKVDVEDQNLICSVIDFGLGIPVERQAHLFERFYRVPADNNYKVSGFGLGLYISAEIIKRLHGKIWLSSTPGKGSAFSFSLPIKHD